MGILTSYLGNQIGSNPSSTGDFLADYFGKQLGASANNPQANVTPQSTTINYNEDGSADITHKQTVGADNNAQAQSPVQPVIPQSYQAALQQQQPQVAPPKIGRAHV